MKKYLLENLDCANCALGVEEALNKMPSVKSAKVVFATKSLIIETSDMDSVISKITELEPDIKVIEHKKSNNEADGSGSVYKETAYLVGYIALFALGVWGTKFLSAPLNYIGYALLVAVYITAGRTVIMTAFKNILKGKLFDENFLMTFATLAAFAVGAYSESVAVMLFYRAGEFFQDLAVNKSRRSIKALLEVRPDYANVIRNGVVERMDPSSVAIGDVVMVKAGEKIPLDGIILKGRTEQDMRALTGESVPVSVGQGDTVLAGALNLTDMIEVAVTKPFAESSIAKVLELVENAASNKAKTETFITKFARYYTPAVFGLSLLIAVLPPLLGFGTFNEWIYRALVVLVVSCPCALIISVPLGYFGGLGGASKHGILIKGANFLEALASTKYIALDKTGTLTKGVFKVTDIVPHNGFSEDDILKSAAIAESHSNHPIAKSIRQEYRKPVENLSFDKYEELSGLGVRVIFDDAEIMVGNDRLLHDFNIAHDISACNVFGGVVHVVVDNTYAGYIVISDELKNDSAEAIAELKSMGISDIVVLTGDNRYASEPIMKKAGITEYYTDLMPEDKAATFKSFLSRADGKGTSIFVGDGINDAPVLAMADVGVSMGELGSDAAIESADVVIMNDSLMKLPEAIRLAKTTKAIIWQNIIFALSVKGLFVVLGFFGVASMWEAVFGDIGVALIALFNSMRVLK